MNIDRKIILAIVVISSIVLFGVISFALREQPSYAEGRILLFFDTGVTIEDANQTVSQVGGAILSITGENSDLSKQNLVYEVEVSIGDEDHYINLYTSESAIKNAQRVPYR